MKMLNGANVTGSESHAFFTRKWNSFTMIAHERVPNYSDVVYYQSARNYSHYQTKWEDCSWYSAELIWCGINQFRQQVIILDTSTSEEKGCETLEPQQEWWANHIKGFFMHIFMPHQRTKNGGAECSFRDFLEFTPTMFHPYPILSGFFLHLHVLSYLQVLAQDIL